MLLTSATVESPATVMMHLPRDELGRSSYPASAIDSSCPSYAGGLSQVRRPRRGLVSSRQGSWTTILRLQTTESWSVVPGSDLSEPSSHIKFEHYQVMPNPFMILFESRSREDSLPRRRLRDIHVCSDPRDDGKDIFEYFSRLNSVVQTQSALSSQMSACKAIPYGYGSTAKRPPQALAPTTPTTVV